MPKTFLRSALSPEFSAVFATYPADAREKLTTLRALILDVAAQTEDVGTVEDSLKWGEPAYLTTASKSGSTIHRFHGRN